MPAKEQSYYFDADRGPDQRKGKGGKHWIPAELNERHHEIKRMLLLGMKNVAIAAELSVSEVMVSAVKNSSEMQKALAVMRAERDADAVDVSKRIKEMAPKALDILSGILEPQDGVDADPKLQASVAKDILDRAGHGAVQKSERRELHATLTAADLVELKKQAQKAALDSGSVMEAEFTVKEIEE